MSFFKAFVISAILAGVVLCIIYRIVIAIFRAKVLNLVYYNVWCRIDKEVSKFVLTIKDGRKYGDIGILDENGEPIELETDDLEIMKILRNTFLFECIEINPELYECIPNAGFKKVVETLKPNMIKTSKKLHNQFESYPMLVQAYLEGAKNVLTDIDKCLGI